MVDSGVVSGDSSGSGVLLLAAGVPPLSLLPNDPGFIHTNCSSFFLTGCSVNRISTPSPNR